MVEEFEIESEDFWEILKVIESKNFGSVMYVSTNHINIKHEMTETGKRSAKLR